MREAQMDIVDLSDEYEKSYLVWRWATTDGRSE